MPVTFTPPDYEFAAASGSNVNTYPTRSVFDYPPNSTRNLTITANPTDDKPFLFEPGETYDLTWQGHGGGVMEDAVVIRSDYIGPGQGAIVFEGINSNTGELFQMVWSPGFDLENWFWTNGGASNPPGFWTSDQDPQSFQYVCFAEGMWLDTPRGPQRIEDLRPGDLVTTRDNGPKPVLWIGARRVPGLENASPVVIGAGALGNDAPVTLSRQHRVLVRSSIALAAFGSSEVWVPAVSLVDGAAIVKDPRPSVTWHHVLLRDHDVMLSSGLPVESLFLGDMANSLLPGRDRAAIARIRAERRLPPMQSRYPMLTACEGRFLAPGVVGGIASRENRRIRAA